MISQSMSLNFIIYLFDSFVFVKTCAIFQFFQNVTFEPVRFASFFSGGVTTMIVINPPERKLAKRTTVQCLMRKSQKKY